VKFGTAGLYQICHQSIIVIHVRQHELPLFMKTEINTFIYVKFCVSL